MNFNFLQKCTSASGSVTAATFTDALFNSSLIVVCMEVAAGTVTTVADTAGNTYSLINSAAGASAGTWNAYMYYAFNNSTQSSNVVSVTHTGGYGRLIALEYAHIERKVYDNEEIVNATASGANDPSFNVPYNGDSLVLSCCFHLGTITGVVYGTERTGPDGLFSVQELDATSSGNISTIEFTSTDSSEYTLNSVVFRTSIEEPGDFMTFVV